MRKLARARVGLTTFIVALLLSVGASVYATQQVGVTISVGGVKLYSNSVAPCHGGDTCLWANGNQVYVRTSGGIDVPLALMGAVVNTTSQLTSALAGTLPVNSIAVVKSTNQIYITYDQVNWTALS